MRIFLIATKRSTEFPEGYYEFDPENDDLVRYKESPDPEQLAYCFNSDGMPYGAATFFVICADLFREAGKYANRGYRFTLLEAGAVAQNMTIVAALNHLATCELGSFVDDALSLELSLEKGTVPLVAIAIGQENKETRSETGQADVTDLYRQFLGEGLPVSKVGISDIGPEGSAFGAYAIYSGNEIDTISGATATSLERAMALAVVEGYERVQSGMRSGLVKASAAELGDTPFLRPEQIFPFTARQRIAQNLDTFDPTLPIEWKRGARPDGTDVMVPADLVYYPYRPSGRRLFCRANSSGVAAHSSYAEARKRALLELVERDAIMQLWLSQQSPKRVPDEGLPEHERRRARYWKGRGRTVSFLNLSGHGAAIVLCVIEGTSLPFFVAGAAASVDSTALAARKSFREAEFALLSNMRRGKEESLDLSEVRYVKHHSALHRDPEYCAGLAWITESQTTAPLPQPSANVNDLIDGLNIVTIDLSDGAAPIRVVRCLSDRLVPITFGRDTIPLDHPAIRVKVARSSARLPHFFA